MISPARPKVPLGANFAAGVVPADSLPDQCSPIDAELERQIDQQAELMHSARSTDAQRSAWLELVRLHGMRSPERIEQMERECGLR